MTDFMIMVKHKKDVITEDLIYNIKVLRESGTDESPISSEVQLNLTRDELLTLRDVLEDIK